MKKNISRISLMFFSITSLSIHAANPPSHGDIAEEYGSVNEFSAARNGGTVAYKTSGGIQRVITTPNKNYPVQATLGSPVKIDTAECVNNQNCDDLWEQAKASPMIVLFDSTYDKEDYYDYGKTESGSQITYCLDATLTGIDNLHVAKDSGSKAEIFAKHWRYVRSSKIGEGDGLTTDVTQSDDNPTKKNHWELPLNGGKKDNWNYNPFPHVYNACVLKGGHIGFVTKFYEYDGSDVDIEKVKKFSNAILRASSLLLNPELKLIEFIGGHFVLGTVMDEIEYSTDADPFTAVSFTATWGALKRIKEEGVQISGRNYVQAPHKSQYYQDGIRTVKIHVKPDEYAEFGKHCYTDTTGSFGIDGHVQYSKLRGFEELGCVWAHDKGHNPPDVVYADMIDARSSSMYLNLKTVVSAEKGSIGKDGKVTLIK